MREYRVDADPELWTRVAPDAAVRPLHDGCRGGDGFVETAVEMSRRFDGLTFVFHEPETCVMNVVMVDVYDDRASADDVSDVVDLFAGETDDGDVTPIEIGGTPAFRVTMLRSSGDADADDEILVADSVRTTYVFDVEGALGTAMLLPSPPDIAALTMFATEQMLATASFEAPAR